MSKFFDFDSGGNGGSQGPWLSWKAKGSMMHQIPAESFAIRDDSGTRPFDGFKSGVMLDIENMKTGWQHSEGTPGVAPKWVWGSNPARLPEQPGDDYKRGFSIPCAIGGGETATWEDASAAAWQSFTNLVEQINAQYGANQNLLPVVVLKAAHRMQFGKGATSIPELEIVAWKERPETLKASLNVDVGQPAAQSGGTGYSGEERAAAPEPQQQPAAPAPREPADYSSF